MDNNNVILSHTRLMNQVCDKQQAHYMKSSTCKDCGCLERNLGHAFYVYGRFVGRNPLPFVLLPLLLAAGSSVGLLHKNLVLDAVYLYTPNNAPSRTERRIVSDLFPVEDGNYEPDKTITDRRQCMVTVTARDGGNILRPQYGKAVEALNKFVLVDIVLHANASSGSQKFRFVDLCMKTHSLECYNNTIVTFVNTLYERLPQNLTFPTVRFGAKPVYLGSSLGGVVLRYGTNLVRSADAWLLIYHLRYYPENIDRLSGLWEREFQSAMQGFRSKLLRITYVHSQTLNEELQRNADRIRPRFIITFAVLVAFSVICSMTLMPGSKTIDWVVSKPLLALVGVVNAGMAVSTSIGLLSICSYVYNDIVAVMPFLAVSIGVDNMFLMLSAWRRSDRLKPVDERLGRCLSECAISILITMLTDAFSFGVGTITTIPAVQIFCVYTCAAITFTFFLQLTFFVGLLAFFGRAEERRLHCIYFRKTVSPAQPASLSGFAKAFQLGSVPDPEKSADSSCSLVDELFGEWYAPILMHPIVKGLVVMWLFVFLGFAVYGCTKLREGLRPVNLLVSDSYAIPHYEVLEKYFWAYGPQVQIVVKHASNLSTHTAQLKAMKVASAFANTAQTIGMDSVQFFLPEYLSYLKTFNYSAVVRRKPWLFYTILKHDYLKLGDFSHWNRDLVWGNVSRGENPDIVYAYRFTVGMQKFRTSNEQRDTLQLMRAVAARFPESDITTFMFFWLFADQYRVILPNTLQNIAIALVIMVVISMLLIPQPLCSMWVALAIASIDVGVIGYMTLWGVNLDAISMITIVMSIGFSVDFSAHITYGYVVSKETGTTQRIQSALTKLGWPIVQGGLSTVLGVLTLADAHAYMIVTFFKTVFLVIVIGLVHGLVFLPVLLSLFVNPDKGCRRQRQVGHPAPSCVSTSLSPKGPDAFSAASDQWFRPTLAGQPNAYRGSEFSLSQRPRFLPDIATVYGRQSLDAAWKQSETSVGLCDCAHSSLPRRNVSPYATAWVDQQRPDAQHTDWFFNNHNV